MYDPELVNQGIDDLLRFRRELEERETEVAEWEAIVGTPLAQAMADAHARHDAGGPYALVEALGEMREELERVRAAFGKVAEDRNMWRARAKRSGPR